MDILELVRLALEDVEYTITDFERVPDELNPSVYKSKFTLSFNNFGVSLVTAEEISLIIAIRMVYTSRACQTVTDQIMIDMSQQGIKTAPSKLRRFLLTTKTGGDIHG